MTATTTATTVVLDEEDENLAHFLESEVLSVSDQEDGKTVEEEPNAKRSKLVDKDKEDNNNNNNNNNKRNNVVPKRIESGIFSKVPSELFPHILKFLSSEDLVACSLVCRFLNYAASDEFLWRRLYCMRWGLLPPTKKLRQCPWKQLYIQRDEEDMNELVRDCQPEFKEYYIQMQAAKRSQAPLPSQVNDDRIILDKTVADQVSTWKSSRGLTDMVVTDHSCSGETCSYYHIGDVFICEKTGLVHVCDDACREIVMDPTDEILVCKISGHCFDRLLSAAEMEPDTKVHVGVTWPRMLPNSILDALFSIAKNWALSLLIHTAFDWIINFMIKSAMFSANFFVWLDSSTSTGLWYVGPCW